MIYPTRPAVLLAAAGAPVALAVGIALPATWYAGLAWPLALLVLAAVDALSGARTGTATLSLPASAYVGEEVAGTLTVALGKGTPPRSAPRSAQVAVAADALVAIPDDGRATVPLHEGQGAVRLPVTAVRRGTAHVSQLWLRWRGGLGLVWHQRVLPCDLQLPILPDLRPVHDKGAQLFQRHALAGLMAQMERGDGTEFESLVEYRSGMDRRAIDWKQSARHLKLHAKEYRSERNNQIVFAVDAGRQMTDPVAGLPRVDRAVAAMLLTAWVALRLGDRVALHAFDAAPRVAGGFVSGAGAFAALQRQAAAIDYSGEETNYTFALTTLAARLNRRSMIVLFTEFTDTTSADFLVRAVARLAQTHLLMVVVLRDEELEDIVDRAPADADDVTRAVTAAGLLRDRLLVLTRLRHLGVHVVESPYGEVGERLVAAYVDLKRRNLL